jgi:small subunit ribosomal protein S1
MTPDPWENVMERYAIGTHVSGQVVALKEYGAFIEIEEGLEILTNLL